MITQLKAQDCTEHLAVLAGEIATLRDSERRLKTEMAQLKGQLNAVLEASSIAETARCAAIEEIAQRVTIDAP